MTTQAFQEFIWTWYRTHGRDTLPWRKTKDPYRVLVSEIMLQQTQVKRVIQKYTEFLEAFPSIHALARAPLSRVLEIWQGLGYNRRARALHESAKIILSKYHGRIPPDPETLLTFPGIGAATAGAVTAFAFNRKNVFIETNIRRVYLHFFFAKQDKVPDREILKVIAKTLPRRNPRSWYYALMDFGALGLASEPNPNQRSRTYRPQSKFRGSRRELRGWVVREIIKAGSLRRSELRKHIQENGGQIGHPLSGIVQTLIREGILINRGGLLSLPS